MSPEAPRGATATVIVTGTLSSLRQTHPSAGHFENGGSVAAGEVILEVGESCMEMDERHGDWRGVWLTEQRLCSLRGIGTMLRDIDQERPQKRISSH